MLTLFLQEPGQRHRRLGEKVEEVCRVGDAREGKVSAGVEEQKRHTEALHDEGFATGPDDLCSFVCDVQYWSLTTLIESPETSLTLHSLYKSRRDSLQYILCLITFANQEISKDNQSI